MKNRVWNKSEIQNNLGLILADQETLIVCGYGVIIGDNVNNVGRLIMKRINLLNLDKKRINLEKETLKELLR